MPKFNLVITVSGYCKGVVEGDNEHEAREKFDAGDWRETNNNYTYELEEITEED